MNDISQPRAVAEEYLAQSKLLQVATFAGSEAGFAHVWFAYDADLNLYFASNISRRHSEHVRRSGLASFGVVSIPLEGLGQKVRGLTGQGAVAELEGETLAAGYHIYSHRWPRATESFPISSMQDESSPMRIYKIIPFSLVLWDEENFPSSPRQVVIARPGNEAR